MIAGLGRTSARRLIVCVSFAFAAACAESSLVPPTAPSPLNPDRVAALGLDCPAVPQTQSPDGNPTPVDYPSPMVRGGEAPVSVTCDPASGTRFPVGATRVSCTATDALGQGAACTFVLRVLRPPMLGVTRILAFGNSLTAGVLSGSSVSGGRSYPAQLEQRLRSAYRAQSIRVLDEGLPGELAAEAPGRLASALARHRPEVVLLMEGTNDLGFPDDRSATALAAIDGMLRNIGYEGATAVVATIPPVRPASHALHAARIPDFNRGLRAVAAGRGAALVDIHGVLARGRCVPGGGRPLPCIGPDGLHPTAEGYGLMADAFFDHLVRKYDRPVAARAQRPASSFDVEGGVADVD